MQDVTTTFGKIVATPTPHAWSQAYNAGNLFAVLSLSTEEETLLNALGKDVIKTLEEEYFTLEEKTLASIKEAVIIAAKKIPVTIQSSFLVASIVNDVVYVYLFGKGSIRIQRINSLGTILSHNQSNSSDVLSASGHVDNKDQIILQTENFSEIISQDELKEALKSQIPSEAVEELAPKVHEGDNGAASAIILSFQKLSSAPSFEDTYSSLTKDEQEAELSPTNKEVDNQDPESAPQKPPIHEPIIIHHNINQVNENDNVNNAEVMPKQIKPRRKFPNFSIGFPKLSHNRKLFLSIILILIAVFLTSLYFTKKNQEDQKRKAAFTPIYQQAEKKYKDAQALESLNKILSESDYQDAKTIIVQNKDKFPPNTAERKQLDDLLSQITAKVGTTTSVSKSDLLQATSVNNENGMLTAEKNNTSGLYFTTDNKNIYFVTSTSISLLNSFDAKPKEIITNNGTWHSPAGLGVYNGNLYLLDSKDNQIYKFVEGGGGYGKSDYILGNADFSNAIDISIDSAIYVLYKSGSVDKYLRGVKKSFTVSGLSNALKNPTRIYTNDSTNNLYILDNGNSRVVELDKTGAFISQYSSSVLATASDFRIDESNKKIFLLSSGTIYSLTLK